MTATAPTPTATSTPAAPSRLPAWLLVFSPLGYLAVIVVSIPFVMSMTPALGLINDMTRQQMDAFATGWLIINFAQLLAGVGLLGVLLLGLRTAGRARAWGVASAALAALGLVALAVGIVLRIAAAGFTGDSLGDDGRYAVGTVLVSSMTAPMLATVLLCVALRISGRLRVSSIIIAILAAVYAAIDVLSYITGMAFPPILATLTTWLPLGIVLLRRPRGERRTVA